MPFPESTQTNSWTSGVLVSLCFPAVGGWGVAPGAPGLTYADLIVGLSVADAAEFKLVERIRELALGCRQVCESRSREKGPVTHGKVPKSRVQADT